MLATTFEFRYRFFVFGLIYMLGFAVRSSHYPLTFAESIAGVTGHPSRLTVQLCFALAALIVGTAAALRTWATAYLQGSVVHDMAIHSDSLVADGPYRYVRNPLYLGTTLLSVGIGFLAPAPNWLFLVSTTLLFSLRLIYREEAELELGHPKEFLAFKALVPRLIPSLKPRVPSSARKPQWIQAWLAESFMWAFAAAMFLFAVILNGRVLTTMMIITLFSYAIGHVFHSQRQKQAASHTA